MKTLISVSLMLVLVGIECLETSKTPNVGAAVSNRNAETEWNDARGGSGVQETVQNEDNVRSRALDNSETREIWRSPSLCPGFLLPPRPDPSTSPWPKTSTQPTQFQPQREAARSQNTPVKTQRSSVPDTSSIHRYVEPCPIAILPSSQQPTPAPTQPEHLEPWRSSSPTRQPQYQDTFSQPVFTPWQSTPYPTQPQPNQFQPDYLDHWSSASPTRQPQYPYTYQPVTTPWQPKPEHVTQPSPTQFQGSPWSGSSQSRQTQYPNTFPQPATTPRWSQSQGEPLEEDFSYSPPRQTQRPNAATTRPQRQRPNTTPQRTTTPQLQDRPLPRQPPPTIPPGARDPVTDPTMAFRCNMDQPDTNPDEVPDNPRSVNNDLRQFALDLLIKLVDEEPGKNLVVSTFSVWNVLLMILEGAEEYSNTARQIQSTLYLRNATTAKIRSNFQELECSLRKTSKYSEYIGSNALIRDVNQPLNPNYERILQDNYQSDLININVLYRNVAVKTVNSWVQEKTQERIKSLVTPRDFSDFNLILANAVFFKAQWNTPFNITSTSKQQFFDENRRVVSSVNMMHQYGSFLYSFIREINSHVLDIPYEGHHFRMLIVLPKFNETLSNVLRAMKKFPVNLCYERLVLEEELYSSDDVRVYLPRFKIKRDLELKSALTSMGIEEVFTSYAKLSKMSGGSNLYLKKIIHAAEIEVNEEGTVASAVTGGVFGNKSKPPNFIANRPFAYFIVENQLKTVIFAGKVVDPALRNQT